MGIFCLHPAFLPAFWINYEELLLALCIMPPSDTIKEDFIATFYDPTLLL